MYTALEVFVISRTGRYVRPGDTFADKDLTPAELEWALENKYLKAPAKAVEKPVAKPRAKKAR